MQQTFTLEELEKITYDAMKHVGFTSVAKHREWFEQFKGTLQLKSYESFKDVHTALRADEISTDIEFNDEFGTYILDYQAVAHLYDEYGKWHVLDIVDLQTWIDNGAVTLKTS